MLWALFDFQIWCFLLVQVLEANQICKKKQKNPQINANTWPFCPIRFPFDENLHYHLGIAQSWPLALKLNRSTSAPLLSGKWECVRLGQAWCVVILSGARLNDYYYKNICMVTYLRCFLQCFLSLVQSHAWSQSLPVKHAFTQMWLGLHISSGFTKPRFIRGIAQVTKVKMNLLTNLFILMDWQGLTRMCLLCLINSKRLRRMFIFLFINLRRLTRINYFSNESHTSTRNCFCL